MDSLDVARWQFGITTVYHFLFVPLTIGLAFVVAGYQTAWYRCRPPVAWDHLEVCSASVMGPPVRQ